MAIAFLFLTAMLATISAIDFRTRRIPDLLSAPLLIVGLLWSYGNGEHSFSAYLVGAAAGYAMLAAFGWSYFLLRGREGLGLGDAKLFASAGAWLGWQALPFVLVVASVGGLAFALVANRADPHRNSSGVAFGPWISIAIWLMWTLEWRFPN